MPLKHFLVIQPLPQADPLDQPLPQGDATVSLDASVSMVGMPEPQDIQHGGFKTGDWIELTGETSIGRKEGNTIHLPTARRVSGKHCVIQVTPEGATFRDVGSSLFSKVGGVHVEKNASRPLTNGDEIILPDDPQVPVYFVAQYVTKEDNGNDPSQTQVDDRPTTVE